jgi:hypothetical protein
MERRAVAEDELGGFRIPAGSTVVISPWVTHRHARPALPALCSLGARLAAVALPSAKLRDHRHADPGAHHGREEQRQD